MKKLVLLAIALTVSVMANAQASIQASFLMNTSKNEYVSTNYNGVAITADYNIPLVGNFSVAPGLGLDFFFTNNYGTRYREIGLSLPVDFNIAIPINDGFKLAIFAGPSLYYGLMSKDFATNPPYDYHANDNNRFDMAVGGGIWCDIQESIRVKIGYKFGVINNSKLPGVNEKSNTLMLSIGYIF